MAVKMGMNERSVTVHFGASQDWAPTIKEMRASATDLTKSLESAEAGFKSSVSNLGSLFEQFTSHAEKGNSFLSAEGMVRYRKEVDLLKKSIEDLLTGVRQSTSSIANELDVLGGRAKKTRGEMMGLGEAAKELGKQKNKVKDAAALLGVSFGIATAINDAKQMSETLDRMAMRMKSVGVSGDDLRNTFGRTMAESKGYIGDVLSMMDAAETAGIRNLDTMRALITDTERLAQIGDVERTPLIQMLGQMHTVLDQDAQSLHSVLQAVNELRNAGVGSGSLKDTLGFVGGMTPQLQGLRGIMRREGSQYGINTPDDESRALARIQANSAGLSRVFTQRGLPMESINELLRMPNNEAERSPALGTLFGQGGISYDQYQKSVLTGDLVPLAKALQQVAVTFQQNPANRLLDQNALSATGYTTLFGANPKESMAQIAANANGPNSLVAQAQKVQSVVEASMSSREDLLLKAQEEWMNSTAGQWREFGATMQRVLANVASLFDVNNPPMQIIATLLNGIATGLEKATGLIKDNTLLAGTVGGAVAAGGAVATGALLWGTAKSGGRLMRSGIPGWAGKRLPNWVTGAAQKAATAAPAVAVAAADDAAAAAIGLGAAATATPAAVAAAAEKQLAFNFAKGQLDLPLSGGGMGAGAGVGAEAGAVAGAAGSRWNLLRSFGKRFGRFGGPLLGGAVTAGIEYGTGASSWRAIGAGLGSTAGAIGGAFAPVPGGAFMGSIGGGIAGEYLGGKAEDFYNWWNGTKPKAGPSTGAPADAATGPSASEVAVLGSAIGQEFFHELEAAGFYRKLADAIVNAGKPDPNAPPMETPGPMAGAPSRAVPSPAPTPPSVLDVPVEADPGARSGPAAGDASGVMGPPKPKGFLERTGEAAGRSWQAVVDAVLGSKPAPAGSDAAMDQATTPPAVPPAGGPTTEPTLGTRMVPKPDEKVTATPSNVSYLPPERVGPSSTPTRLPEMPPPAVYTPEAAAPTQTVNVSQSEVIAALDRNFSDLRGEFAQLRRNDMSRRSRNGLARAADAMDI